MLKGCLLALGQFVSEAIKAHDVSCHRVMFPFHGQSAPIQSLVENFCPLVPDFQNYSQSLQASSFCSPCLSIHPPLFTTRADFVWQYSACVYVCFRCVQITRRVWSSPPTRMMVWVLERCQRPTRYCRTGRWGVKPLGCLVRWCVLLPECLDSGPFSLPCCSTGSHWSLLRFHSGVVVDEK